MNEQVSAATVAQRVARQQKIAARQIEWDALLRALPYAIQSLTEVVRRRVEEGERSA